MISAATAKERTMESNSKGGFFSEAPWLAKKDARRAWMSYPASGLCVPEVVSILAGGAVFVLPARNAGDRIEGRDLS